MLHEVVSGRMCPAARLYSGPAAYMCEYTNYYYIIIILIRWNSCREIIIVTKREDQNVACRYYYLFFSIVSIRVLILLNAASTAVFNMYFKLNCVVVTATAVAKRNQIKYSLSIIYIRNNNKNIIRLNSTPNRHA